MSDLPRTIAQAAHLIEARQLSPVELVKGLLQRIESVDPIIHSFLTVTAEHALKQARAAEDDIAHGRYRGPLHGIPFGAKDNYETAGIRTTGHSKAYAEYVPHRNAAVIDKLDESGAVLMGKLALHELAHGGPSFDLPWPLARNPWNPTHFTGGSSSGSGAAVAAGLVLFALGSDTGGSIRTPASLCGLVGIKPTFGLVSRYGVIPNCYSLDHCGPMANTVEDCAILLQAMAFHDSRDRSSASSIASGFRNYLRQDLEGVRIGVVRHFWEEELPASPELRESTEEALRVLASLGARLEDVRLRPVRDYCDVWTLIEAPETFSIQRKALLERAHDFGRIFLERTLLACLIDAADYTDAQRARSRFVDEVQALWRDHDVLFTAGAGPAPVLSPALATWPNVNRFSPFAVTGNPAVVVPSGLSKDGLPMSVQFVGAPFRDAQVLGIAHAYERAGGLAQRRANVSSLAQPPEIPYETPALTTEGFDRETVRLCTAAANQAGLALTDGQLALLCSTAPRVFDMKERVRRLVSPRS
ncbi:MAG TPA: amidase, partial [Burkholderiales bacterium]|nr:amidase [Burkholderiales bacterium]